MRTTMKKLLTTLCVALGWVLTASAEAKELPLIQNVLAQAAAHKLIRYTPRYDHEELF